MDRHHGWWRRYLPDSWFKSNAPKKTFQPTTLLSIFSTLPCQETASHPEHAGFETVARDGPGERGCDSHCQTMETVVTWYQVTVCSYVPTYLYTRSYITAWPVLGYWKLLLPLLVAWKMTALVHTHLYSFGVEAWLTIDLGHMFVA